MKPAPFDYVRAESLAEALDVLGREGGDARVIAGGQSLMPMLNMRLAKPRVLVDIMRLGELAKIDGVASAVTVGAGIRQAALLAWRELEARLPMIALGLPLAGHAQTRSRGTVCGSIAHADPSSEIPLSLAVLGGEVVLRSRRGARVLAASDFQRGMLTTAREPDELIAAVRFPIQATRRIAFREVVRRHGDFAIIAAAVCVEGAGAVRIGIGGMADRPAVRRVAIDRTEAARDFFESLAWELEGYDDTHASARLRRDLLRRFGPVVVEEALRCAA